MKVLRLEQKKVIDEVGLDSALVVAATGFGKSICMAAIIEKVASPTLVLTPTNILKDQLVSTFNQELGENTAGALENVVISNPVICSTMHRIFDFLSKGKPLYLGKTPLILIDQVHRARNPGTFYHNVVLKIVQAYPDSQIVGFTASPGSKVEEKVLMDVIRAKICIKGVRADAPERQISYIALDNPKIIPFRNTILAMIEKVPVFRSYLNLLGHDILEKHPGFFFKKDSLFHERIKAIMMDDRGYHLYTFYSYLYATYLVLFQTDKAAIEYLRTRKGNKTLSDTIVNSPDLKENLKFNAIYERSKYTQGSVMYFFENYTTLLQFKLYLLQKEKDTTVAIISGNRYMRPNSRAKILQDVRSGSYKHILATSAAEEGIDIGSANRVVCYEPITNIVRYIQRIGRTGRKYKGYVDIYYYKKTHQENAIKRLIWQLKNIK